MEFSVAITPKSCDTVKLNTGLTSPPTASVSYFEKYEGDDYRFKAPLTVTAQDPELAQQSCYWDQHGRSLRFPQQNPATEESFDDAMGLLAEVVNLGPIPFGIFREKWKRHCPSLADIISKSTAKNFESLINDVVKYLFPLGNSFRKVEGELYQGKEFEKTKDAQEWFEKTAALYVRLAKRWNQMYGITNGRLAYAAMMSLPPAVRMVVQCQDYNEWSIDELFERAEKAEQRLKAHWESLPTVRSAEMIAQSRA